MLIYGQPRLCLAYCPRGGHKQQKSPSTLNRIFLGQILKLDGLSIWPYKCFFPFVFHLGRMRFNPNFPVALTFLLPVEFPTIAENNLNSPANRNPGAFFIRALLGGRSVSTSQQCLQKVSTAEKHWQHHLSLSLCLSDIIPALSKETLE